MWFDSLQIVGSRWGPYCNKIPLSWEVSWRWCPHAVYWSWLLEHHPWLNSGTLLSLCSFSWKKPQNDEKGKQCYTSVPQVFTVFCPNAFFYCLSFQKATNPQAPWFCSCCPHSGQCLRSRKSRKGNTPLEQDGAEPDPQFLPQDCDFNISLKQTHISWQCWGWPGVQTWSAQGGAIILKCFYWSVDFLSPSFSSSLHPASLLKAHILSHTTKVF